MRNARSWEKGKFDYVLDETDEKEISRLLIGRSVVFIALTAFCVAVVYVPDAICWHVTPDAMLIKELTEVLE